MSADGQAPALRGIHAATRCMVGFVWVWHGLVPKLLARDPAEVEMTLRGGVPERLAAPLTAAAGYVEIAIGLATLLIWRQRVTLLFTAIVMPLVLVGVAITSLERLGRAFNPVTTNLMFALCAWVAWRSAPRPAPKLTP